jgi:hypothetical protein
MRVIIDTNLWISFLIGHQTQLVSKILTDQRFDVYVCNRLIEEIRDVVSRGKIRKIVSDTDINELFSIINAFCVEAVILKEAKSNIRDPKDLYLLSLAETIDADYIISGDLDLLDLHMHKQTRILKLSEFKSMMLY